MNDARDVYVKDLLTGTVAIASSDSRGLATGGSDASISASGRFVVYQSSGLVDEAIPTLGFANIFIKVQKRLKKHIFANKNFDEKSLFD